MAKEARVGARVPKDGSEARTLESLKAEIRRELGELDRQIVEATAPPPVPLTNEERIVSTLSDQHPIDGVLGEIFMELGGKAYMKEWAEENPNKFIEKLLKAKPAINPIQGRTGDLVIRIESSLGRTSLDEDNIVSVQ